MTNTEWAKTPDELDEAIRTVKEMTKLAKKSKIFTDPKTGATVDRTFEFAKPDPVIKVTLADGYVVRFWEQRLTNEEYIKRTLLIQQDENEAAE